MAYLLLTLAMLFFAGNAVLARLAAVADLIPPFSLSFWRWFIALLILLAIGLPRVRRQWDLYRAHLGPIAVLGLLSVSLYNGCQYLALEYTTAVSLGIVHATMPMAIVGLTWLRGQERASAPLAAGLVAAFVGVVLVVARGEVAVLMGLGVNAGDALALVAVGAFALYSVLLRDLPPAFDPLGLLTVQVVFGVLGIAPFYVWEVATGRLFAVNLEVAAIVGYVAIFPSILSFVFWTAAIKRAGANTAGLFVNLLPVFIALLAVLLLGERIMWFHLVGGGLIFAGIGLAMRGRAAA
ncbi:MAG: DMT family transporter [Alphaproteobacteria bacterium]|nr:DMT family transporter [Alphaproteobacteria bacterium]